MAFQIAPSLLACDFSRLADEVQAVEAAGADVLHLDVMDGQFVPNITIGPPVIKKLRPLCKLPFDAHLMIANADKHLAAFRDAGCDWISVHVEACPHLHGTLQEIQKLGMKAGVAINPGTSLFALEGIMDIADYILVMSVNPGFGGQKFIPATLDRIREVKRNVDPKKTRIQVDGGIKEANLKAVVDAGGEIIVMGTGFFEASDYQKKVTDLRKAVAGSSASQSPSSTREGANSNLEASL